MGQYLFKPAYWHANLLGAVEYRTDPAVGACGSTYVWDDRGSSAFRFKDAEWKKGTALRKELEEFLDAAMEQAEGAVEQPRLEFTTSAFCCGGCPNHGFVTPELVEEFNNFFEKNKNKKLLDMGLVCRAIYQNVNSQYGPIHMLVVLVEEHGDYVRFDGGLPI